jgi:hypothetical protein
MQTLPLLVTWVQKSIASASPSSVPPIGVGVDEHHKDGSAKLSITKVLCSEEDIWAPAWGLKGKVDATVLAHPHVNKSAQVLKQWVEGAGTGAGARATGAAAGKSKGVEGDAGAAVRVYPLELKTVMKAPHAEKVNEE